MAQPKLFFGCADLSLGSGIYVKVKEEYLSFLKDLAERNLSSDLGSETNKLLDTYFLEFANRYNINRSTFNVYNIKGSCDGKKILIVSCLDQEGFVVSEILDRGYIGIAGYNDFVHPKYLPGLEYKVWGKREVIGYIGVKPPHLQTTESIKKELKLEDLKVDTGLPKDELESIIDIGDFVTINNEFIELKNSRIAHAGLKSKVAGSVLYDIAKGMKEEETNDDIILGFISSGPAGQGQLKNLMKQCKPDCLILIGTIPAKRKADDDASIVAGNGIAVDYGSQGDNEVSRLFVRMANNNGLNHQINFYHIFHEINLPLIDSVISGTNCDCLSLRIPVMNYGTTFEIVDLKDMENASKSIVKFCKEGF